MHRILKSGHDALDSGWTSLHVYCTLPIPLAFENFFQRVVALLAPFLFS